MTSPLVPAYDPFSVVVGMGALFYQPHVVASPPEMPPDTLALGAAWPAPWTPVGATHEGITLSFTRETADVPIEEAPLPVDVRTQTVTFNIGTVLAEDTLETLLLSFGGGTITAVAADVETWGYRDFVIADEMQNFAIGWEGRNKHGYPRRQVIPFVKSVGEIESSMRRTEKHMYNTTIRSLSRFSECPIHDLVAEPTG